MSNRLRIIACDLRQLVLRAAPRKDYRETIRRIEKIANEIDDAPEAR